MKLLIILLILAVMMTAYFAVTTPAMIPTLIVGWVMMWLQVRFECFN